MGVMASMSISLMDRGRLWGLVACHHYSDAHRPSYTDRVAAEFLGRTASLLLHTKVEEGRSDRVVDVAQQQAQLVAAVGRAPRSPLAALTDGDVTALDLLPAGGVAVRLDGRLRLLGETPPGERVVPLVTALAAATPVSERVPDAFPQFADLADVA